jgi:outer membrane lipoprotein-sorting protein
MRMQLTAAILLGALASNASALTVDELVSKNIEARGGIDAIRAIQSIKASGRMNFSGGDFSIDLGFASLNERDAKVRIEATIQGLTQITAYDGKEAWTINPFQGRRDPERMSAEDSKGLEVQSDIDGPLVDWKRKGHQVEYLGTEDMDGTEAHKLKIALKNGDIQYRYLDPDYFLEILVVDQSKRRGVETEMETELGNYEKVAGVYMPFAMESGPKGGRRGQKITIEKAEANVDIDDSLFAFPQAAQ